MFSSYYLLNHRFTKICLIYNQILMIYVFKDTFSRLPPKIYYNTIENEEGQINTFFFSWNKNITPKILKSRIYHHFTTFISFLLVHICYQTFQQNECLPFPRTLLLHRKSDFREKLKYPPLRMRINCGCCAQCFHLY